eukprot:PhF_6_TR1571/c0_g1_i1/m.2861/K01206/FUCA; alpha-L-fucosidase
MISILFLCLFVASSFAALPLPTPAQLRYQHEGIVALIHFNMATFVQDGDPACNPSNWNTGINCSNPLTFNPTNLNVSQWAVTMKALGIQHSVLTAKHGCGFLLWETATTLPDGSPYGYGVRRPNAPSYHRDVVREYVETMRREGMGYGFYYSTGNNFYLNRVHYQPAVSPPLPGQANVTDAQFEALVIAHITELWTQNGELTEIWFDGGFGAQFQQTLQQLVATYQTNAVAFGGQGVSNNPLRWVGTEMGTPPYPVWSTASGGDNGQGSANGTAFIPATCDTTLQQYDHWFWTPGCPVRTMRELIQVYHDSVGSNCVMELDFAIDRTGNIDPVHNQRYLEFASWISSCYGKPVVSNQNGQPLLIPAGTSVDRVRIREDQTHGEAIRTYSIFCESKLLGNGTAIGARRIQLLSSNCTGPASVTIVLGGVPNLKLLEFSAFSSCPTH